MSRPPRLILASGSPRRREILERLGYVFEVRPVEIDESQLPGETALEYVRRLAEEKARHEARPGEVVLAADTIVALGDELLGKPQDEADARNMLTRLAGCQHSVSTGVAVVDVDRDSISVAVETTLVEFTALTSAEIHGYVATGEPMDKAGAYAIQGVGSLFVKSIEGNYSNVVGLPVPAVYRLLESCRLTLLTNEWAPSL